MNAACRCELDKGRDRLFKALTDAPNLKPDMGSKYALATMYPQRNLTATASFSDQLVGPEPLFIGNPAPTPIPTSNP